MPEISRFFGLIVAMYYDDHPPPPFHARYGGQKGRFAIDDLRMLDGDLSPRTRGLIIEWASQHLDELRQNWARAEGHAALLPIKPLE